MAFDSNRLAAEEQEQNLLKTHPSGFVRIRSVEHPSVVTEVTCAAAGRHLVDGTGVVEDAAEGVQ
jgi:hypothetical protein